MGIARDWIVNGVLAILGGLLLRASFGLQIAPWTACLAWVAPMPLLVSVMRSTRLAGVGCAFLGGLIASGASLHYYALTMPLPAALLNLLPLALLWTAIVVPACRAMTTAATP